MEGQSTCALPDNSDINLFRYFQSIIDLDAKVSDGALDFGMPQEKLNCPQISRTSVDQGRLGSPQRMCAEAMWVKPDAGDPLAEDPRVTFRWQHLIVRRGQWMVAPIGAPPPLIWRQ